MNLEQLRQLLESVSIHQIKGEDLWFGPGVDEQRRIIDEVLRDPQNVRGQYYVVTLGALAKAITFRNQLTDKQNEEHTSQ